jgi:NADH:ubiquinone oxidoreductase subunit E
MEKETSLDQIQLEDPALEGLLPYLDEIILQAKDKPGSLIPLLQQTQKKYGYLPKLAIKKISHDLNVPFSEVAGVVGFYSFFSTTPKGKNVIRVCQGTACYVRGGNELLGAVKSKLKIDIGGTTKDQKFSLESGRCFGVCGLAPVMTINDEVVQRAKPSNVGDILKSIKD